MSHGSTTLPTAIEAVARKAGQLRVVDYLRVSTEQQKRGYGVARQAKRTTRHIATQSHWDHVGTFKDEGVSGALEAAARPDLNRLMELARQDPRPFDLVVVPDGRVIGRKGRAFWRWVWTLENLGVYVGVVADDYDNSTSEGRKKMRRDADCAETEWETILDRTQGGLQEKAELVDQANMGGRPPYGYRIKGKGNVGSTLEIDPEEEKIIHYAYDLIVSHNLNLNEVAIRLNSEGIFTRSGVPWKYVNLRDRILSVPLLEGSIAFRGKHARIDEDGKPIFGEPITITLPRILTPEQAKTLRSKATQRIISERRGREIYPLSGRVVGACKKPYTGLSRASTKSGTRHYRCSGGNSQREPGKESCGCAYVNAPALESHVWGEVVKLIGDGKKLEALVAE